MWQLLGGAVIGGVIGTVSGLIYYRLVTKRLDSSDDYLHELEVKLSDHKLSSEKSVYRIKKNLFSANKYWFIEDRYGRSDVIGVYEVTDSGVSIADDKIGVASYKDEYFIVHDYGILSVATNKEIKDFKAKRANWLRKRAKSLKEDANKLEGK